MASHALVIFGITGRMGQSLVRAVREGSDIHLTGAVASSRSERLGLDAATDGPPSGVLITADSALALRHASVAVDFSLQDSVLEHAQACAAARVPLLVGATGLGAESRAGLKAAAHEIPVLIAPNTSVGIALLRKLVAAATQGFGAACEVEISEAHHRLKRDAPSGTALSLGELVAETRGEPDASGIRYSVVRAGEIVGEHTVSFGAPGERLEITHRATDRMIFARGALRAAAWLVGRAPGLYGMQDVLGV